MHHRRHTGPGRPEFDPPSSWKIVHYMHFILSILTLTYVAIAAFSYTESNLRSPRFKDLENGWGYYLVIVGLSVYPAISMIHWFTAWRYDLSPTDVFIGEIFIMALWLLGLAGEVLALISYISVGAHTETARFRSVVRIAHGLALGAFPLFILGSLVTLSASYRQFREARASSAKYTRRPTRQTDVEAANLRLNLDLTPTFDGRPSSSGSETQALRGTDSQSRDQHASGHTRTESGSSTLTRDERVAQNVDAVTAPPTYWYATSSRAREREGSAGGSRPQTRTHNSSDTLPLYNP
ncbi:hypothetical protein TWF696_006038 [Orbilia brochopaga]|uniref:Uncharacterized protein n=1 Tax=Orbilia brochopaga TaxID=3140254 RepID=A0AAV9UYY5_9PEZI